MASRIEEMAHVSQAVIIGGGFGGLAAARQLRHVDCTSG
jgi:cation diffusion facilitator CzcD-associated flavoprotein CzcO